jgi:hypothetical protein
MDPKTLWRSFLFSSTCAVIAGCSTLQLESSWHAESKEPQLDQTEEPETFLPFDQDNTFAGVQNDKENIFLTVRTTNRAIMRGILRWGLTTWFDPSGGKEKSFGIHYPVGARWNSPSTSQGNEGGGFPSASSNDVDIFESGNNEPHRMSLMSTGGIEASTRMHKDTLTCFLKVPLLEGSRHPFAIGAHPGTVIGLGVESSPPPRVENRGESMGSERGEGRGGQREGGGRGRGGFGRGGRRPDGNGGRESGSSGDSDAKPFSVWAQIHLAAATSSTR